MPCQEIVQREKSGDGSGGVYPPTFHDFVRAHQEHVLILGVKGTKDVVTQNERTAQRLGKFLSLLEEIFRHAEGQEALGPPPAREPVRRPQFGRLEDNLERGPFILWICD